PRCRRSSSRWWPRWCWPRCAGASEPTGRAMTRIRPCSGQDLSTIHTIINAAAEAYRGVIPPDQWHDPYMPLMHLQRDIAAGVEFWGCEAEGELVGVMGIQPVRDVDLIRHAYVLPG